MKNILKQNKSSINKTESKNSVKHNSNTRYKKIKSSYTKKQQNQKKNLILAKKGKVTGVSNKIFKPVKKIKQKRVSLAERIKRRLAKKSKQQAISRVVSLKKLILKNLYCINILSTKTNHFCSISTYLKGHVLFLETPRMQGFKHTMRRKDTALQATLHLLFKKFFKIYPRKSTQFIVQFTGRKSFLLKKTVRFLSKRIHIKKHQIYLIRFHQFFSHNGCKLQIRKRKKRKGRRKHFIREQDPKLWKYDEY